MNRTCVIMQPTYMPWAGYFNLIAQADEFVYLDDVQFEKTSWQNRNRILLNGKSHWITVPVRREHLEDKINTIKIDDQSRWREKQYKTLEQTYSKHPYGKDALTIAEIILDTSMEKLLDLNLTLISKIMGYLGIKRPMHLASDLGVTGSRSDRLTRICAHLNCSTYLSPIGSQAYLERDGDFAKSQIKLLYQNYNPPAYPQKNASDFVSHLSVVDAISNLGSEATYRYVTAEGPVIPMSKEKSTANE